MDSVGPPIEGVEVKVLEPDQGGCGELLVRGPNVMLGYTDPGYTAEAIRDGWLHTGDIARIDEAGNIVLTGRSKRLIVTESGKNVYPEELETLLERDARVKEAAVLELDMRPAAVLVIDDADPAATAGQVIRDFNARMSSPQPYRTLCADRRAAAYPARQGGVDEVAHVLRRSKGRRRRTGPRVAAELIPVRRRRRAG
ncbi:MAG: AMP-binding protein [Gammaproteobacteria bacterium]|nr:AMP-binding protein [Gammaproteobacteria bacterium]